MALKSALQDLKETSLPGVSGRLGKLAYLASLRRGETYEHWGLSQVYGAESSTRAMRQAHSDVLKEILRAPLESLVQDLKTSSDGEGVRAQDYVERLRGNFEQLVPDIARNSAAEQHLNSVLAALSGLEQNRGCATLSAS